MIPAAAAATTRVRCLLLAVFAVVSALIPQGVAAAPADFDRQDRAVVLSPPVVRSEQPVPAGGSTTLELEVLNQTTMGLPFSVAVAPVAPEPVEGDGVGGLEVDTPAAAEADASEWVTVDRPAFRLGPDESRVLRLRVVPPVGTAPGGYDAAVVVQTRPGDAGEVDLVAELVGLVVVRVAGPVERRVAVALEREGPPLSLTSPIEWRLVLRNDGNVHEFVEGSYRVDGAWSDGERRPLRRQVLFPGERRASTITAGRRLVPDLVEASARVEADAATEVAAAPRSRVLLLPWQLLLIALAAGLLVTWRTMRRRH